MSDYEKLHARISQLVKRNTGLGIEVDRLNGRLREEQEYVSELAAEHTAMENERDKLKSENEAMKAGIDPKWCLMDQSILVDYLREQTNFCAEKFDGMIQFAVDAANREFK